VAIVVVLGSIGVGRAPSPPPDASTSAGPAGPSVAVIDPAECALSQSPTTDEPPLPQLGDGPFDPADLSPAWLRVCMTEPVLRGDEIAAFCNWSLDRQRVEDVEAFGANGQPQTVSIGATGAISIGRDTGPEGYRSYATPRSPTIRETSSADGSVGAARFELVDASVDPAGSPAIEPPVARGTVRWQCGPPPAPRAGLSAGQISLHLDAPIGQDLAFEATCRWISRPAGPEVASLDAVRPDTHGGVDIGISIEPVPARPERTRATLSVTNGTDGGEYRSGSSVTVAAFVRSGAAGTVRLSRLTAAEELAGRIGPGLAQIDGTVTWTCQPSAAPGDSMPPDDFADEPTDGLATLTVDPAVVPLIRGRVACYLGEGDPQAVPVSALTGVFEVAGGGRLVLSADAGDVLIGLIGPDGAPAGEYRGQATRFADDALGPVRIEIDDFAWLPTDPRYVPLGGALAPRTLELTLDVGCDIASARIPGLSVGTMEVHLASGLDRSWAVPAVCRWEASDGGPRVVSVKNLGPIDLDSQGLLVQTVPDLFVIVTDFGTSYGSSALSTIRGQVAADGSSGERIFAKLEPRGRIFNANGRLGGIGGVLEVDGSVRWTCGGPPAELPPAPAPSG
jgi:hypothetical protein